MFFRCFNYSTALRTFPTCRPLTTASSIRGGRFLILHLELVHYLTNVRNRRSNILGLGSAALTADIPIHRNHAVLHAVFDSVLPSVLNEGGVQVLVDRLV